MLSILYLNIMANPERFVLGIMYTRLNSVCYIVSFASTLVSTGRRVSIVSTDHNLWDIIVDGDLQEEPAPTGDQSGPSAPPVPKTAKQLAAKRNQERVKSILLLAIPDEYLLKFHNVPDAKSLWEAIKSRFGGNEESKKMQKNVLKHQFENFTTAPNESLDKAYDRFQKLISQLEVYAAPVSKEDINQKFLRSLPPSWSQIALIMRNKPDIDQTDIDDLYNNLRVYEDEMKRTNEVSTASGNFRVNTAGGTNSSSQVSSTPDDLERIGVLDGSHRAMLTVRVQRFIKKTGRNLDFKGKQPVTFDKSQVECYNYHRKGHFAKECKSGWNQGKRSYGDNGRRNGNPKICLQDHAVVDSGCSSHMTDNKAYLSDYEDYNGGFVAFGSDPKGKAMRLQVLQEEEAARQVHLDALLAKRILEEEELLEQQKKRKPEVQEAAQYYTEEDWDTIRAKLEANAELTKSLEGESMTSKDFAKKMVEMINQKKKLYAEQKAKARRSKPMTQAQQRDYMSTFIKNQSSWKLTQLKKLTFDELKTEFEKLVKSIENFVPMETDERVKRQGVQLEQEFSKKQKTIEEVSVLEESITEPVIAKEEEIEKSIKKRGKIRKQKARKGIHIDKTAQDESEEEREAFMKDKVTSASSESEIGIDAIPTATKPPSIVDWKIIPQSELYKLVIKKYGVHRPEEIYDRCCTKALATPEQTATGKEISNPLIADSLLKTIREDEMLLKIKSQMFNQCFTIVALDLSKVTNPLQAKGSRSIHKMTEQDSPLPTITAMKILIIKKGEYDIWSMRMRQYICHTDHNLWDIIVNGDLQEEPALTGDQSGPSDSSYEMKRSSSSTTTSQNLAFLSSENTSRTNEVSTASGDFGTTSPPLENEDLQQIDEDDLEELDLRWQVAMLTVRVKKFIQKTERNLDFKGKQPVSLDKSKVECYNCQERAFCRECNSGRNQGKRPYGDNGRRNAPTNELSSQALVAQDGLGGYDWSNDFDEPINYALMAISSSSSSSSSDNDGTA
ncbi:hypothetical protein Tco_1080569 [Tanacetum coccineum]|uniref:Uncharacterized protein n=1 Tax=Tanacetum coccineum TaxID=301880 RepID=A0ABQ5HWB9_9ASTR